jgi:hypothetical protein
MTPGSIAVAPILEEARGLSVSYNVVPVGHLPAPPPDNLDLPDMAFLLTNVIVVRDGWAYVQAGAGIVADSDPECEYIETHNKAQALFRAIEAVVGQEDWV